MKENLEYDFDEVMSFCQNEGQTNINDLIKNLNDLVRALNKCEDKFHCKGGNDANALMKIYDGFSKTIGYSNGVYNLNSGAGLAKIGTYAASLLNTCYAEAAADKKRVDDINGMNW